MNEARASWILGLFVFCLARFCPGRNAAKNAKFELAVRSKAGNIVYLQVDIARVSGYFSEQDSTSPLNISRERPKKGIHLKAAGAAKELQCFPIGYQVNSRSGSGVEI